MSSAVIGGDSSSSNGGYTPFSSAVSNGTASNGAARNGSARNVGAADNNGGLTSPRLNNGAAAAAAVPSPILDAKQPFEIRDFEQAYLAKVKEFDDEKGDEVLFCTNIEDPDFVQEFCPRGVVLERNNKASDDPSLWNAWIHKVPNMGHRAATSEIGGQLRNYAIAMSSKFDPKIQSGGGHEEVKEVVRADDEVLPERRVDPDEVIRLIEGDEAAARVVVEVELSNRDPFKLSKHVHRLMKWDHLRCVIGLKIYKRPQVGAKFACVCFVWKKKKSDNSIYVERVFDLGPTQSKMRSVKDIAEFWSSEGVDFHRVSKDNGQSFQVTPMPAGLDYPLPEECPDDMKNHFTVSVDKEDVYHGHTPMKRQKKKKLEHIVNFKDDAPLEIDLFLVLTAVDEFKAKNFKSRI